MLRAFVVTAAVAAALATPVAAAASGTPSCALPAADRAWVDRAVEAWRLSSAEITGIKPVPGVEVIIFSADCALKSRNALSSKSADAVIWTATPHSETIALPDGSEIPVGVTSFAAGGKEAPYFVMSTPSVWQAAGVGEGAALERLMVAVMLHESSHLAQIGPYGPRLGKLIDRYKLPDDFNDNAVEERFKTNTEFAESVNEESRLFLEAAGAKDAAEAKRLAGQGRRLMLARQARWMVGDDAYLVEAEDIWLTFEGAGQWTAFQWLVHPKGGAQPQAEALPRFAKSRRWSQTEGFAIVMALDRIVGPGWKSHAYGDGARTVLEMLDDALKGE